MSAPRGFLADRGGTAAIEFAMIAVPFIGLIAAIFETGAIYFRTAQLQVTTETASRGVLTRSLSAGKTYQQFIDESVCTHQTPPNVVKPGTLSTMFDCNKVMVDIRAAGTWSSANLLNDFYTAPPSKSSAIPLPSAGQIAIVRIAYPMPAATAIITGGVFSGQSIGSTRAGQVQYDSKWTYMLLGVYAFRVEP
jgi:hypothetical protein